MAKTQEKTGEQVLGNQVLDTTGALTKIESTAPTAISVIPADDELAKFSGAGNEHVRPEDVKTPFLMVLQSGSPECKRSDPRYVTGAEEGMFMHGLTKQLYDGRFGVEAIDCFFDPLIIRWKPRGETGGGGFRGAFSPGDRALAELKNKARPNEKNELILDLPDGTQLVNTNQHYLLVRPYVTIEDARQGVIPSDWLPCCLSLGSTQIKKSREMNAIIGMEKVRDATGQLVPIPRFGLVWRLTTVPEKNDKGSWMGVKFERFRRVDRDALYSSLAFHKFLAAGERRADVSEVLSREEDNRGSAPSGGVITQQALGADGKPVV